MSNIEVVSHNLSSVDYQQLLETISQEIQQQEKCVGTNDTNIFFDVDTIADNVARKLASSNNYPFENKAGTTYAAIHALELGQKEEFSKQIKHIAQQLNALFLNKLAARDTKPTEYLTSLLTPVTSFAKESTAGLSYPLHKAKKIEKQRLHLSTQKQHPDPWLKAHKLTLQVKDIPALDTQVTKSICSYLEKEQCPNEDIEDARTALEEMIKKPASELGLLRDAVVRQSVARIYREAKVRYLRYLLEGMNAWRKARLKQPSTSNKEELSEVEKGVLLLRNLILRLQGLDAYIRQEKEEGYFQVTVRGNTFNYRDIFSREDAFDPLPIIPEIDGFLGESTNQLQGSKTFVSGLKLKLNGPVQVHGGNGQPVFDYNLALLDSTSALYKAREAGAKVQERFQEKVLKVALLYCFVFLEIENPQFHAGAYFEQNVLPILKSGDETAQIRKLQELRKKIDTSDVRASIDLLRKVLTEFLRHQSIGPAKQEYPLVLSLHQRLLVTDVDKIVVNNLFFRESFDQNGGRNVLKYVAVEDANASKERICTLPLTLTFEPIYYSPSEDASETFHMTYETQDVQTLPIFLAPVDKDKAADIKKYAEVYGKIKRLSLYYRHHKQIHSDSEQAFVYRFTYALLTYIFIKVLTSYITSIDARKLFLPVLCIHTEEQTPDEKNEKFDDESFMHALSKILEHMLAEDYTASSQGFYLDTVQAKSQKDRYKLGNALYSLYTALPRIFRRQETSQSTPLTQEIHHQLEKLAIIVVSSRKCDENKKTPDFYKATVFGEVVGIECLEDETVRIGTLSTFSINQDNRQMYKRSDAVLEQVKYCYEKGYRHFLYVAHAPYSSTLHISDPNEEADLFFMNKDIIQAMREVGKDVKVYPVFCDKYYVVNRKKASKLPQYKVDSLYVDDIGELSNLANDPSKKSLIFFNLFSGATVNPDAIYNGVMSYATLINVYQNDPTYDQYIWNDLLSVKMPQSLGRDILDYITLLHFSRYEKSFDIRFKLDPFIGIIGDKSVGKVAVTPHMLGRVRFNILAFLTEVRAVLRADK